jgi:hypothetical protein
MLGAGGTVWFAVHGYRQYAAIEHLELAVFNERTGERHWGKIDTSNSGPGWLRAQLGDLWMRAFERPVRAQLIGPEVDDADLARLSVFPELESLTLADTGITDEGLEELQSLGRLKTPGWYTCAR